MQVPASFFRTSPAACGYAVVRRCHRFGGGHENALRESGIGNAGGRRARRRRTRVRAGQFPLAPHPPRRQLPARRRRRCGGAAVRRQARARCSASRWWSRTAAAPRAPSPASRSRPPTPDGYTVLVASNSMLVAQVMNPRTGLDIERDLQAIASTAPQAVIVVTRPDIPAASLGGPDRARAHAPAQLRLARRGLGAAPRDRASVHRASPTRAWSTSRSRARPRR